MIVWSKGLGKMRLPMELADAKVIVTPDTLLMDGLIVPTCWNYSVKLKPEDLEAFLKLMADRKTVAFLSERRGILLPFLFRLILAMPGIIVRIIASLPARFLGLFGRKQVEMQT